MSDERDAVFTDIVIPAIKLIADKCEEHKIPLIAIAERNSNHYAGSTVMGPGVSLPLLLAYLAKECDGSMDKFLLSLLSLNSDDENDSVLFPLIRTVLLAVKAKVEDAA